MENYSTPAPNFNVRCMRAAKQGLSGGWMMAAVATLIYTLISGVASYTFVAFLLIYGPLTLGYVLYLTAQYDRKVQDFNLLFQGFNRFAESLVAGLLYMLIVLVGCALLIVPGIIAACGLSMTFFIMAENPNITGVDALKLSWEMMKGRKMDYFCLCLRFLGWALLCVLTFGIGSFWLEPYMTTTFLVYYRGIKVNADRLAA